MNGGGSRVHVGFLLAIDLLAVVMGSFPCQLLLPCQVKLLPVLLSVLCVVQCR